MNKLLSLTALIAVLFTTNIFAQDLSSGVIIQELTEIKSDDPNMAAQLSMLKGSTNKVYFNEKQVLSSMDMMGGMMKMSTLTDRETGTGFMLFNMDMLGKKTKVDISADDVKKGKENTPDMKVTYDKADTKVIAGYKCYKATISSPMMQGAEIIAYVTEELSITADIIQGVSGDLLSGFPLEYQMGAQGMSMVYTTVEIKKEVNASDFQLNTDGYETQTMEQFQKSMSAMGGGMGF